MRQQYILEEVEQAIHLLEERKQKAVDVITPAGLLHMRPDYEADTVLLDVKDVNGNLVFSLPLNDWANSQIAQKTGIPIRYYEKMLYAKKYSLLANNVNTWLDDMQGKRLMVRAFENEYVRAILSDSYFIIPDLGIYITALKELSAVMDEQKIDILIQHTAVTDTHIYLKAYSPDLQYVINEDTNDYVFAGLVLRNSEVGASRFSIQPMLYRPICKNGLIASYGFSKVHLGARQGEGIIKWSERTKILEDATIKSKIRDVIRSTFDPEFIEKFGKQIAESNKIVIEEKAKTVEALKMKFNYTEEDIKEILFHFGRENNTLWGLANAVTRYAQDVGKKDYDRQIKLEEQGTIIATMTKEELEKLKEQVEKFNRREVKP